jgi:small ubiquitin-related modifier
LQDGYIVHFKIKKKTRLQRLMEAYSAHMDIEVEKFRFVFDGVRLRDSQTPDELEMEDGDVIEVNLFQVGDIGEWGEHAEAIGTRFLKGDAASRDDAQGIMRALGFTKCRPF